MLAGVLNMVVGFLWYSPWVFGPLWIKASGVSKEGMKMSKNGMGGIYATSFGLGLLLAAMLYLLLVNLNLTEVFPALKLTFALWLGFVFSVKANDMLYSQQKSPTLFWIGSLYYLASMAVMALVFTLWY